MESSVHDVKPYIWLQKEETEGRAACGCCLVQSDDGPKFYFCALHAAAGDLLKACKAARISVIDDEHYEEFKPLIRTLEAAIARAKPATPKNHPDWFA